MRSMMPVGKWLFQGALALVGLFVLFATIQYLKGRGLQHSLEFGVLWSLVSTGLFFSWRVYLFRQGRHCRICDDLPAGEDRSAT